MVIDKQTRDALTRVVQGTIEAKMEVYDEVWVSGAELGKRIGCFTKGWMKKYAISLPRTQARVVDQNNIEHWTGWVYPLHKIQAMMMDGRIKELDVKNVDRIHIHVVDKEVIKKGGAA